MLDISSDVLISCLASCNTHSHIASRSSFCDRFRSHAFDPSVCKHGFLEDPDHVFEHGASGWRATLGDDLTSCCTCVRETMTGTDPLVRKRRLDVDVPAELDGRPAEGTAGDSDGDHDPREQWRSALMEGSHSQDGRPINLWKLNKDLPLCTTHSPSPVHHSCIPWTHWNERQRGKYSQIKAQEVTHS